MYDGSGFGVVLREIVCCILAYLPTPKSFREHTFSAAKTALPATVFLLFTLDIGLSSTFSSSSGVESFAFLPLSAILVFATCASTGGPFVGAGATRMLCLSRLARVASAERSSGLQLIVCRSVGMRSLLNSCADVAQSTSGGGGDGGRAICRGGVPLGETADKFDELRLKLGFGTILAEKDCVGEE